MQDESSGNNAKSPEEESSSEMVGFRRASNFGNKMPDKGDNQDFSFMKKRVRVNVVDKNVQEYPLEQDEIDAKKRKGKRYW